jgi:Tfp pilus assembly PilM family ATPase
MSNSATKVGGRSSVIAIIQQQDQLKAVEFAKRRGSYELVWTRCSDVAETDLATFAAECGLSVESQNKILVAGFDSASVVYYRINVPVVKDQELAAIVNLQAEAMLPLPADQMESAWRASAVTNGQVPITIAAARKQQLQEFVDKLRGFEPAKILLGCEAIVKAWRRFFSGNDDPAVVVDVGPRHTQVCLAQRGRLTNAVSLDIGTDDFADATSTELNPPTERFAQDMTSVLELFGYDDHGSVPVFVLSGGGGTIANMVASLQSAGLKAAEAVPDLDKLTTTVEFAAEDICEFLVPIGLASIVLDNDAEQLNVFERLYQPAAAKLKRYWYHSPWLTGAVALVMLVLSVIALYAVDVAAEKRLTKLQTNADFEKLQGRQKLIEAVARERPDLLALLSEISSGDGIKLHAFTFAKGALVRIQGQADNKEQAYKFEESLLDKKGIKGPKMTPTKGPKDEKVTFTMTFHYKHFTTKKSRAAIWKTGEPR